MKPPLTWQIQIKPEQTGLSISAHYKLLPCRKDSNISTRVFNLPVAPFSSTSVANRTEGSGGGKKTRTDQTKGLPAPVTEELWAHKAFPFSLTFHFKSGGDLKHWMALNLSQGNKPLCHYLSFYHTYGKKVFPLLHRFVVYKLLIFQAKNSNSLLTLSLPKTKFSLNSCLFFVNDPHIRKLKFSEYECFKWYWESQQSLFKNTKLICWWLLSITFLHYKTITEANEALGNSSI